MRVQNHTTSEGVVTKTSPYSLVETVARFKQALRAHGLTLFATVDDSGEAARVGLTLRPTTLLIFGSPKAGTSLMVAAPLLALDLPLKALIWQDDNEQTQVSYNSPAYLAARHHLPSALLPNIAGIEPLVASVVSI